ncbi:type I-C CRISPR-associated protein Cas8c/Csd1 [Desulfovibrio sp. OttesenSCG-928-I05]|nr:type I-C CRISPR-associated protein Cas8c/Csd1 [Desulfovibrio sp. OttesenSCG-928-I05]
MSWLQMLYETYESCASNPDYTTPPQADGQKETPALMPVSHTSQQAHIHVVLDGEGVFQYAELLPPKTPVILPATEESAGRTSGASPHPLADKIHYCAKDYHGGKTNCYSLYEELLKAWCDSPYAHPKARAVYAYIARGCLVRDLLNSGILHANPDGALLTQAPADMEDSIFTRLTAKKVDGVSVRDQGDALVVWSVVLPGDKESRTWKDASLQQSWINFDASRMQERGLCMVRGETSILAGNHPRNIRRPGDGAKLISWNDATNFTFRGRFLEASQACSVGYEVSHKAHNALRWLIARQGYRKGEQAVLAWAVDGARVPNPCEEIPELTEEAFMQEASGGDTALAPVTQSNMGFTFAERLGAVIRGYKADLSNSGGIAVLALEAASPGRLAMTFYREQIPEQYISHLELWQKHCAWMLPVRRREEAAKKADTSRKRAAFAPYAPSPETIARVAYGRRLDDKLCKATVERLLPCIVDAAPLPRDVVEACVRRACNRAGLEKWEWSEVLGVACAVYRGYYARHHKKEEYTMTLDTERRSRDYLYGRLLAVAEYVERTALEMAGEKRPTNAERLMQRFADHPYATWPQLEMHLGPYEQRLRSSPSRGGLLGRALKIKQAIYDMFIPEEFTSPAKLSGEFLLGYHCQITAFYMKNEQNDNAEDAIPEGEDHELATQD